MAHSRSGAIQWVETPTNLLDKNGLRRKMKSLAHQMGWVGVGRGIDFFSRSIVS